MKGKKKKLRRKKKTPLPILDFFLFVFLGEGFTVGVRACVRCVCACERACSKNGGAKKLHHGKKSNPHKVLLLLLLLLLFGDRQRERI